MEERGWRSEFTYTGGLIRGAIPMPPRENDNRWDDRPSPNPYPIHLPPLALQFSQPPRIVKKLREVEQGLLEGFIHYNAAKSQGRNYDVKSLTILIGMYKTFTEELTDGVVLLPPELQDFLDEHST